MRFLLVAQSLKKYSELTEYCMPLGIAYINGILRSKGFDVDAINMLFEDNPIQALRKKIREQNTDVLMCGGLTSEYKVLKQIYTVAREEKPNIVIVGGGGGFTAEPIIFSELTEVDFAVIGEGEITSLELAKALEHHLPVSEILGIVYRDNDGYHMTPPRPYIKDIDSLPFPSYEGLSMDKYLDYQHVDGWYDYYTYYSDTPRLMPMLMARSCPFQCSFCFHPMGRGYRTRSMNNFFEELDLWIEKYNINGIALIDECFSIDAERVKEFCERIKPYKLAWACQMRADTYTDEVLSAMKNSGCIGACFGIESMSEAVLDNMNKHLNKKTIERALELTYKYRLGCTGNLIFGAETETFYTIAESLYWHHMHSLIHNNYPVRQFSYVQIYPGSTYYKNACEKGLIVDKKAFITNGDWHLNITGMSQEDYDAVEDIIRLCRRENYNCGDIIEIKYNSDGNVDFSFRCSYCGNINHYQNVNKIRFIGEGKIKRLGCRSCNMLGDYILRPEQYIYDWYITIPWFLNIIKINITAEYFYQNGWEKIGFCGMNAFAKKMISHLQQQGLNVKFIYDYTAHPDTDYGVPQLFGNTNLNEVDVLINSDIAYWEKMEKQVRKMFHGVIIYMETLLRIHWNIN